MSSDLPDYSALEPPAGTDPTDYTHHERRAEILRLITKAGTPTAINQSDLADRYGVHDSTISRDMDRLRESVNDHLGTSAKFTTRTLYQHVVEELLDEKDWKATKAAWDVAMDWNDWLQEVGEQHREPDRLEADVRSRTTEVQYRVVRGDPEADVDGDTPDSATTTDTAGYEDLGFTAAPSGEVDVEAVEEVDD
jgi:predicted ArsR family transcriptional regulator